MLSMGLHSRVPYSVTGRRQTNGQVDEGERQEEGDAAFNVLRSCWLHRPSRAEPSVPRSWLRQKEPDWEWGELGVGERARTEERTLVVFLVSAAFFFSLPAARAAALGVVTNANQL